MFISYLLYGIAIVLLIYIIVRVATTGEFKIADAIALLGIVVSIIFALRLPSSSTIPITTPVLPTTLTFNITVPANVEWFDTGIEIKIGQTIQFSASGNINLKGGLAEANSPTPDGQINATCHPWVEVNIGDCLLNDESAGVLVSRIGTGNAFRIGKSFEMVSVEEGILFLAVNDNIGYFQDNLGVYNVKITIR